MCPCSSPSGLPSRNLPCSPLGYKLLMVSQHLSVPVHHRRWGERSLYFCQLCSMESRPDEFPFDKKGFYSFVGRIQEPWDCPESLHCMGNLCFLSDFRPHRIHSWDVQKIRLFEASLSIGAAAVPLGIKNTVWQSPYSFWLHVADGWIPSKVCQLLWTFYYCFVFSFYYYWLAVNRSMAWADPGGPMWSTAEAGMGLIQLIGRCPKLDAFRPKVSSFASL